MRASIGYSMGALNALYAVEPSFTLRLFPVRRRRGSSKLRLAKAGPRLRARGTFPTWAPNARAVAASIWDVLENNRDAARRSQQRRNVTLPADKMTSGGWSGRFCRDGWDPASEPVSRVEGRCGAAGTGRRILGGGQARVADRQYVPVISAAATPENGEVPQSFA